MWRGGSQEGDWMEKVGNTESNVAVLGGWMDPLQGGLRLPGLHHRLSWSCLL